MTVPSERITTAVAASDDHLIFDVGFVEIYFLLIRKIERPYLAALSDGGTEFIPSGAVKRDVVDVRLAQGYGDPIPGISDENLDAGAITAFPHKLLILIEGRKNATRLRQPRLFTLRIDLPLSKASFVGRHRPEGRVDRRPTQV